MFAKQACSAKGISRIIYSADIKQTYFHVLHI